VPAAQEHPAVEEWTPAPPPPPQRRAGPGLLAGLIALLLVFGMVGLVAARQAGGARTGAGSPEGAASGLLAALDRDVVDARALDRAARYLTGEERLLIETYGDRIARLAAAPPGGPGALGILGFSARNVRFQRLDGGDAIAVLEAVSGTVRLRSNGGGHLELSLDEARQRLAEQTGNRVISLRVVTVRSGGRWYVALLPTALEWSRVTTSGGAADYARLTAAPAPGASSPEAAVRPLLATLGRPLAESAARLTPGERNAVDAYEPALRALLSGFTTDLGFELGLPGRGAARTVIGTERVAEGVVRVHLDGEPSPYVIALQRGGTWYPSMVFTLTDVTLTSVEREHS
jgi:hypothetical protein